MVRICNCQKSDSQNNQSLATALTGSSQQRYGFASKTITTLSLIVGSALLYSLSQRLVVNPLAANSSSEEEAVLKDSEKWTFHRIETAPGYFADQIDISTPCDLELLADLFKEGSEKGLPANELMDSLKAKARECGIPYTSGTTTIPAGETAEIQIPI